MKKILGPTNFTSFLPSVAFYIETCHLIGGANEKPGFYMKWNVGLKLVKLYAYQNSDFIARIMLTKMKFFNWLDLKLNKIPKYCQLKISPSNWKTTVFFLVIHAKIFNLNVLICFPCSIFIFLYINVTADPDVIVWTLKVYACKVCFDISKHLLLYMALNKSQKLQHIQLRCYNVCSLN